MNKIVISEDLFLDNLELNKMSKFILEDNFGQLISSNTSSYGIVKNNIIGQNFNGFKVTQGVDVSGSKTVMISDGVLISLDQDSKLSISRNKSLTNPISIPSDGNWYWIKIKSSQNSLEEGVLSISADGILTGVGTKFTSVLRGQPNFPSKIKFYKRASDGIALNGSTLNGGEYEILQVISDTQVLLQGDFSSETGLMYSVVGTFTPGYIVPTESKNIFRYSEIDFELVAEVSSDGSPVKPYFIQNNEFFIYRVRSLSGVLDIQDFRTQFFKLNGVQEIEYVSNQNNPIVGIEKISFDNNNSTRENNIVKIGFGVRSSSYSINSNTNKVTLNNMFGGVFKDNTPFVDGMFDEYRMYVDFVSSNRDEFTEVNQEKYYIIKGSTKVSSSVELILDRLQIEDFLPKLYSSSNVYSQGDKVSLSSVGYILYKNTSSTGVSPSQTTWSVSTNYYVGDYVKYNQQVWRCTTNNVGLTPNTNFTSWELYWDTYTPEIVIVPNCEEIVFVIKSEGTVVKQLTSNVRNGYTLIDLLALNDQTAGTLKKYNISYCNKTNKVYSPFYPINDDAVGYDNELGTTTAVVSDYFKDFITLYKASDAFSVFKNNVDRGDFIGVNNTTLSTLVDVNAYKNLKVGIDKQYQYLNDAGSFVLVDDFVINISKFRRDSSSCVDGNKFVVHIKQNIIQGSYNLIFKQGAETTPGTGGSVIHTCTETEYNKMKSEFGLTFQFIFSSDTNSWVISSQINENSQIFKSCVFRDNLCESGSYIFKNSSFANTITDFTALSNIMSVNSNQSSPSVVVTHNSSKDSAFFSNKIQKTDFSNIRELRIDLPSDGIRRMYSVKGLMSFYFKANSSSGGLSEVIRTFLSLSDTALSDGLNINLTGTNVVGGSTANDAGGIIEYFMTSEVTANMIHDGLSNKSVRMHYFARPYEAYVASSLGIYDVRTASMELTGKPI